MITEDNMLLLATTCSSDSASVYTWIGGRQPVKGPCNKIGHRHVVVVLL